VRFTEFSGPWWWNRTCANPRTPGRCEPAACVACVASKPVSSTGASRPAPKGKAPTVASISRQVQAIPSAMPAT
jgi:hypothetical protein